MARMVTSDGADPNASRARGGKAFVARAIARPPSNSNGSSNPQAFPLSAPGPQPPGRPLRLPRLRLELVGTRPPQKRWWRKPNLLRPRRLHRMMTTTCTFACRGRRWRQEIPDSPRRCSIMFPRVLSRKIRHQSFVQFRLRCRHPRRSSGLEIPAPFRTHVSRSCSLAGLAIPAGIRWTPNRIWWC